MSLIKHTKGPWHIEPLTTTIVDADRTQIATAYNYGNQSEAEANAKLIASAPELLEALQNLITDAEDRGEIYDDHGDIYPDWEQAISAVRKATLSVV